MLKSGNPPDDWNEVLSEAKKLDKRMRAAGISILHRFSHGAVNMNVRDLVLIGVALAGCTTLEPQQIRAQAAHDASTAKTLPQPAPASLSPNADKPEPLDFDDHLGYVQIFDGVSLNNWDGDPAIWHVENGAIVGEANKERPVVNSYISFRGFEAKDFDLKLEIKVEKSGGSGIQYRSKTGLPWAPRPGQINPNLNWMMTGPQADYWFPVNPDAAENTGQFYSENTPLGILARRGQVVESAPRSNPKLVGNIGDRSALGGYIKVNDWNQYLIMARGGTFIHVINGQLMAVYVDDDPKSSSNQSGLIGIEIEGYPHDESMKVSVRNIWIKKLQ